MKKPSRKTINPFSVSADFEVPAKWNVYMDNAGKPTPVLQDIGDHTRIYKSLRMLKIKRELSRSAVSLYDLIIYLLRPNQDFITLTTEYVCEELKIAPRTFRDARSELNFLISRRDMRKDTYWVNPAVIYGGNRASQFPTAAKPINKKPEIE